VSINFDSVQEPPKCHRINHNLYIIQALELKKSELAQILIATQPTFTLPLEMENGYELAYILIAIFKN